MRPEYWAERYVPTVGSSMRDGLLKKARRIGTCGCWVRVRSCECGHRRAGSGVLSGADSMFCHARTCPNCASYKGQVLGDWVERAIPLVMVQPVSGVRPYHVQYMVLTTTRIDGPSEDGLWDWRELRGRHSALTRGVSLAWKGLLKVPGAAMMRMHEVSPRGAVHTNILYYGPTVSVEEVAEVARRADPRIGTISSHSSVHGDSNEEVAKKAGRIARYSVKPVGGSNTQTLDDGCVARAGRSKRKRKNASHDEWMSGSLAMAWEIATFAQPSVQKYGAFRGLGIDKLAGEADADTEHPAENPRHLHPVDHDEQVECACCGEKGLWDWERVRTEDWLDECHEMGRGAMYGVKWHDSGGLIRYSKRRRKQSEVSLTTRNHALVCH